MSDPDFSLVVKTGAGEFVANGPEVTLGGFEGCLHLGGGVLQA